MLARGRGEDTSAGEGWEGKQSGTTGNERKAQRKEG